MADGSLDLAHILAQLGLNVLHTQCGIEIGLGLARNQCLLAVLHFKESIVVDRHIHAQGAAAQGNMMFARATEMVQRIGKLLVAHEAQVHGDTATQHHARFCLALACNCLDRRLAGEKLHDRAAYLATRRVIHAGNHIDILDRLAPPPEAACNL